MENLSTIPPPAQNPHFSEDPKGPPTNLSSDLQKRGSGNPRVSLSLPDSFLHHLLRATLMRPFTTLTIALSILLLGSVSFFYLRMEYMPTLHIPVVHVVTEYPGFPATEVERLVTIPLENELSAVKGIRGMESITKEGVSTVSLCFDWKVDLRTVTVDIREKIDSTYPYLPHGIQKPLVYTEDLNTDPILVLGVVPKAGRSLKDITPLVRKELSSRLLRIGGVANLRMVGTAELEVLVEGKEGPIQAGFVSLDELAEALKANVFQASLGTLIEGEREFLVEADTGIDSMEELANIPIQRRNGSRIGSGSEKGSRGVLKLRDVAAITLREKERTSFFNWNGAEGIGVFVYKMHDASGLGTATHVIECLPDLNTLFQREFRIEVIQDSTRRIQTSLENLLGSIGMGMIAVFLVLSLTFKNLASPLIISFSIPVSMMGVLFYMFLSHISLNTVSLSGIALGLGMIVDNSIVVLENLHRRKAVKLQEICQAVNEVFPSLFSSTLTTVLVFLPIALIPGVLGALFKDLALTISVLLFLSLGLSLFFTPTLYILFTHRGNQYAGTSVHALGIYRSYLLYSLRYPAFPVGFSLLFIGLGCIAFFLLPKDLLPPETPEAIILTLRYPAGSSLEKTSRETSSLTTRILHLLGVEGVFSEAGYESKSLKDKGAPDRNSWTARLTVRIKGKDFQRVRTELSNLIAGIEGIEFRLEAPTDATSRLLGSSDAIRFQAQGSQRDGLISTIENLFIEMGASSFMDSIVSDTRKHLPQKSFLVKEDVATYHGISPRYILNTLGISLHGVIICTLPIKGEDVDLRLRLCKADFTKEVSQSVEEVPIPVAGGVINAGRVGTVRSDFTYPELHRTERKPSVTWTIHPKEGKREALERILESVPYQLKQSGEELSTTLLSRSVLAQQALHVLQVFVSALLLMYLVLGAQFESFGLPILLLVSFPLSVSSSFLFLYILGFSLNLHSFLGILVLLGTIINGTILLTSSYRWQDSNQILEMTVIHTRPLLATVNTSLVALVPLLLGGRGSVQAHTAVALGGGLGLGTMAILAVYPGLYRIFFRKQSIRKPSIQQDPQPKENTP
ncbi:MAG: efflux RND transporter permease subunit [Spirochaetes bacterium]|nr:efflux RND transporter permease subunit [Spirochaetota bacterium]